MLGNYKPVRSECKNRNLDYRKLILATSASAQETDHMAVPQMKKLLVLALLLPLSASAQVTLLAHTAAGYTSGSSASPITTSAIDTTGASLIAICATGAAGITAAPSDSASNTWSLANTQNEDGDARVSLWYAIGPATSPRHAFTFHGQAPAGAVLAFSNVASGPDMQSQSVQGWGATLTSGSVAPTNPNELVLSCLTFFGAVPPPTVSPLTVVDQLPYNGGYSGSLGTDSAYQVQTAASAVNPAWGFAHSGAAATVTDTFYSTTSPAPLTIATKSLPEGFAGTKYSAQLQHKGGVGPFTWTLSTGTLPPGLKLSAGGEIAGTPAASVSSTPLTFKVTDSKSNTVSTSGIALTVASRALTLATNTSCALTGNQYAPYSGCTLIGAGGTPPYTYTWKVVSNTTLAALPEGLSLNTSTGAIGGTVYGQGAYVVQFIATDSQSATATLKLTFELAGDSTTGGCSLFPEDSIFHHDISKLPVDTSPAAPIPAPYLSSRIRPFFGHGPDGLGFTPNGIPFIRVPYNQPLVPVKTTLYQHYFAEGPFPAFAPVESTSNSGAYPPKGDDQDRHVLVLQTAGGGNPCKLWEMWQGVYLGGATGAWVDASNAFWGDLISNAMIPQGRGSTDAAGLPILPLLLNYDEVAGGAVRHPVRFTLNHMLNAYVWPATQRAGVGGCTGGFKDENGMLEQANPPTSCTFTGPAGEIYRLKANVATPSCAATSPQAAAIIEGFRNYGIILADNGMTGGLIGTPDARWNDRDLACLSQLTLSDFEPVNVSGAATNILTSYQTR